MFEQKSVSYAQENGNLSVHCRCVKMWLGKLRITCASGELVYTLFANDIIDGFLDQLGRFVIQPFMQKKVCRPYKGYGDV